VLSAGLKLPAGARTDPVSALEISVLVILEPEVPALPSDAWTAVYTPTESRAPDQAAPDRSHLASTA